MNRIMRHADLLSFFPARSITECLNDAFGGSQLEPGLDAEPPVKVMDASRQSECGALIRAQLMLWRLFDATYILQVNKRFSLDGWTLHMVLSTTEIGLH